MIQDEKELSLLCKEEPVKFCDGGDIWAKASRDTEVNHGIWEHKKCKILRWELISPSKLG